VPDEVNADLWRGNRRRWKISLLLVALALLGSFVSAELRIAGPAWHVLAVVLICLYIAGMIGLYWARQESSFLNKSEPRQPSHLWRFR